MNSSEFTTPVSPLSSSSLINSNETNSVPIYSSHVFKDEKPDAEQIDGDEYEADNFDKELDSNDQEDENFWEIFQLKSVNIKEQFYRQEEK